MTKQQQEKIIFQLVQVANENFCLYDTLIENLLDFLQGDKIASVSEDLKTFTTTSGFTYDFNEII